MSTTTHDFVAKKEKKNQHIWLKKCTVRVYTGCIYHKVILKMEWFSYNEVIMCNILVEKKKKMSFLQFELCFE